MFVVLFRTGGTNLTSILVKGDVYSQFFEGTTIEQRVFKKVRLFWLKSETNLTADMYQNVFPQKNPEKLWLFGLFSGDIDILWMIKITIETKQVGMDACLLQK